MVAVKSFNDLGAAKEKQISALTQEIEHKTARSVDDAVKLSEMKERNLKIPKNHWQRINNSLQNLRGAVQPRVTNGMSGARPALRSCLYW